MPEWLADVTIEPPTRMIEGARVLHSTFGLGTIGRVGPYKDVQNVWIDWDDGQTKALALEFGLPHLSPQTTPDVPKRRQWFRRGQL